MWWCFSSRIFGGKAPIEYIPLGAWADPGCVPRIFVARRPSVSLLSSHHLNAANLRIHASGSPPAGSSGGASTQAIDMTDEVAEKTSLANGERSSIVAVCRLAGGGDVHMCVGARV